MGVTTTKTNKPINPRGNDGSPLGFNRAKLYSGKALDFDGVNDYVTFDGFAGTLSNNDAWTACGYFKTDSNTRATWFSAHNVSSANIIRVGVEANKDGLFYSDIYTGDVQIGNFDFKDDKWHFVALSREQGGNGSLLTLYVDGVELTSLGTGIDWNTATQFSLGQEWDYNGASDFWNGLLSNFKIFNTALTSAQVADLYNNPEKVVPTGVDNTALKLWLPMMEGAGTTAYDGSSTENGPNLIVNGDFATDSDWTKGTGWSIANGVASHNSSLGAGDLYQDFSLTIGKSYKITIEITATDTTELYFMTDNGDYVEVTGSPIGVHSHVFVADESSHRVGVRGSGNWDGSVDNITLEELNFANHGTISGATYVNGVGAPVAQSAVMDWNKGTNKLINSTDLTTSWNLNETTIDSGYSAPDGSNTAFKITKSIGAVNPYAVQSAITEGDDYRAIYARTTSGTGVANLLAYGANTNNLFTITEEWQKFSIDAVTTATAETNFYLVDFRFNTSLDEIIVWAPHCADSESVYIPTLATAQTSPVLLPQGLTTGRDITGVNLFENVRKQGALNLDGNSWAEVHDNASLDITSEITLEAWVYWSDPNTEGILGRFGALTADRSYMLYAPSPTSVEFYINTSQSNYTSMTNGWRHIVGTYNGAQRKLYVDGVLRDTDGMTAAITTSDKPIEIGRYRHGSVSNLEHDGQLAQPRIYNRALTAEEVQRNYNAGKNIYTN